MRLRRGPHFRDQDCSSRYEEFARSRPFALHFAGLLGLCSSCVDRSFPTIADDVADVFVQQVRSSFFETAKLVQPDVRASGSGGLFGFSWSWLLFDTFVLVTLFVILIGLVIKVDKLCKRRDCDTCCEDFVTAMFLTFMAAGVGVLIIGYIVLRICLRVLIAVVQAAMIRYSIIVSLPLHPTNFWIAVVFMMALVLLGAVLLLLAHVLGKYLTTDGSRQSAQRIARAVGKACQRWGIWVWTTWALCGAFSMLPQFLIPAHWKAAAPSIMMALLVPQILFITVQELVPYELGKLVFHTGRLVFASSLCGLCCALLFSHDMDWLGRAYRVWAGALTGIGIALSELLAYRVGQLHGVMVGNMQGRIRRAELERAASGRKDVSRRQCTLCANAPADAMNSPCGHTFFCMPCAISFQEHEGTVCNACRKPSRLTLPQRNTVASLPEVEASSTNVLVLLAGLWWSHGARRYERLQRRRQLCSSCVKVLPDAVNMPCGHAWHCLNCVWKWRDAHGEKCPACGEHSTIEGIVAVQACDICGDEVAASKLFATPECGHQICSECAVAYVRSALGAVADEVKPQGLRCPLFNSGCAGFLTTDNLRRLQGCRSTMEPDGEPFSAEEVARFERFVEEAGIPLERRFYCVNAQCARMLSLDLSELLQSSSPKIICMHCTEAQCVRCKILWHGAVTCEEVRKMAASRDAGIDNDTLDQELIEATTKKCPKCSFRISHYHGHSCHHIRPGTGCINCGHHFCYSCLRPGKSCRVCKVFCNTRDIKANLVHEPFPRDRRCGCPICPDCRPGPRGNCSQCDGNCVVCLGIVPPGQMVPRKQASGHGWRFWRRWR